MEFGYLECRRCRKMFFARLDGKRKFCSRKCKVKYYVWLYRMRKFLSDPKYKEKSLQRLYAWKKRKKQEKMLQEAEKKGVKLIVADIDWI